MRKIICCGCQLDLDNSTKDSYCDVHNLTMQANVLRERRRCAELLAKRCLCLNGGPCGFCLAADLILKESRCIKMK